MRFINREKETAFLEEKWLEQKAQLIVLWGKRRVGKTELVKQFIKDKPHVYFLSENTNEKEQLHRFSQAIGRFYKEPLLKTRGFAGWEESFEYIKAKNRRFVLVMDEFPYLILSNPAIPALFQKAWDEYWSKGNIYLIILGSNMAMMENEVLGYRSPLYGRRTGQWRIDPMPFPSARKFRAGKSFTDQLSHFSVAGGIPAYWLQLSPEKDILKNIADHVLKKGEFLYDEVEFILREELREPRYYFALLQAVAQGKRKLSEIVNATGISQPVANKYLGVLADLNIVERELPVTEVKPMKSKKGLYRIIDEFFLFWFRFIFPKRGELEMGRLREVLAGINKELPMHLSIIYEKTAIEILRNHMDNFFPFTAIGRWWDRNEEIDIVAFNRDLDTILFGEVKWSEKPVGTDIYDALKQKAKKVQWGSRTRKQQFCLFSKKGFTASMIKLAKEEGVALFKEDKLISKSTITSGGSS
ncbi:MAG: ATP-binding protein [Deferribacteres bacterium]|nr:ATP-binding protein [Deferribacteres bacterium]